MKGDFSRVTFDPARRYTSVRMQQGRMQLDADWNEQADITKHLLRSQAADLLGPHGAPAAIAGFEITPEAGALRVSPGRYYVDGIAVDNDAAARCAWEAAAGRAIAYLDVWERHVTGPEEPALLEPALEGADTTTRTQVAWQVRVWTDADAGIDEAATDEELLGAWLAWRERESATAGRPRLRVALEPVGYGFSNQLYRVEIHTGGAAATFKWSRDNGALAFPLAGIERPADPNDKTLTFRLLGLRPEPQLRAGDWLELDVPAADPRSQARALFRLTHTPAWDPEATAARVEPVPAGGTAHDEALGRAGEWLAARDPRREGPRPVVRRWEHGRAAPAQAGGIAVAGDGALRVEPGAWLPLEAGIEVRFEGDEYRAGDYWLIPARAAADGYDLLWPGETVVDDATGRREFADAPARRDEHFFAPLALLTSGAAGRAATDLRALYEPHTEFQARQRRRDEQLRAGIAETRADVERHAGLAAAALAATRRDLLAAIESATVEYRLSELVDCLEPGQIVALDPVTRTIEPATRENAPLIVGVTVAPVDGRDPSGRLADFYRVAQYGRHSCLVTGHVRPGDLLVPSESPGCAQAAGLLVQPGTVVGKALEGHHDERSNGRGLIEIMVMLR